MTRSTNDHRLVIWTADRGWVLAGSHRPLTADERGAYGLADPNAVSVTVVAASDGKDAQGDIAKRKRPWPTDMTTPCYTTRGSRGLHIVWPCKKVQHVEHVTDKVGGSMNAVEVVTVRAGFDRGKGLCQCWNWHYGGERGVIPGAEVGHKQ